MLLHQNVVYKNDDHLLNLQNISVEAEFSRSRLVSRELRLDFLALGSDGSVAFLPIPVLSAIYIITSGKTLLKLLKIPGESVFCVSQFHSIIIHFKHLFPLSPLFFSVVPFPFPPVSFTLGRLF